MRSFKPGCMEFQASAELGNILGDADLCQLLQMTFPDFRDSDIPDPGSDEQPSQLAGSALQLDLPHTPPPINTRWSWQDRTEQCEVRQAHSAPSDCQQPAVSAGSPHAVATLSCMGSDSAGAEMFSTGSHSPPQGAQRTRLAQHSSDPANRRNRIREKNKIAMQRFRNKQREKAEELESRAQQLEGTVDHMKAQLQKLQAENFKLKLRQHGLPRTSASGQGSAPAAWEPCHGWTDFHPQATIVMRALSKPGESPMRIPADSLQSISQDSLHYIFCAYTARVAPLIIQAEDNPACSAAAELKALKNEIHALSSNLLLHNADVNMDFSDQPPLTPQERMLQTSKVLRSIRLTPAQSHQLGQAYQAVTRELSQLKADRAQILIALTVAHTEEEGLDHAPEFRSTVGALQRLLQNTRSIHRCKVSYFAAAWGMTLDHIQLAKAFLVTFPRALDIWSLGKACVGSHTNLWQEALQLQQQLDLHEHLWHTTHPSSTHAHAVRQQTPQPASPQHDMLLNLDITSYTGLTGVKPSSSSALDAHVTSGNFSRPLPAERLWQPMPPPCIS